MKQIFGSIRPSSFQPLFGGIGFGSLLYDLAQAKPSLDLRFADNKSLVDATTGQNLVTFTRASSGTFVGSDGVLQTASTDVPRFDHNPITGESLGLLVEEQRTNSLANNTMVGAVAGTPGTLPTGWPFQSAGALGLAVSIVGTGTESGIAYLDWKVSGTATANTSATICFGRGSALTAQTWTTSSYLKLAAGSLSGVTGMTLELIEEAANTAFVAGAGYSISLPTTASLITQRPTATRTLTGGATVALLRTNLTVSVSSGSTVDITLRIGLPQLEQGAFATSAILTSTAAATRSADVASITGSAFSGFYRQDEGTVFAEASSFAVSGLSRFNTLIQGATFSDRWVTGVATTNQYQTFIASGGIPEANLVTGTYSPSTKYRMASAIKANDIGQSIDGASPQLDASAILFTANQIQIGSAGAYLNGHLRRLCYWPTRLANNVLQSITQ